MLILRYLIAIKCAGHFTQVVWKGTKEMGVGRATARSGNIYVVANYSPPGNMQGAFQANVFPLGNYNIPDPSKPKKTGLEGEVVDIVIKKGKETTASIAESVYKHLEDKKPDSYWIVCVVRGSTKASNRNSAIKAINSFVNYDLGDSEDKDLVVYELEHPHDEAEAQTTVLNEAWGNKVK